MINIENLEILADGKILNVKASVIDLPYFSNITIWKIAIDNQVTFKANGVSDNPVYQAEVNAKTVNSLILDTSINADLNKDIFIVYIFATGTPSVNTPCGMDNPIVTGVVINKKAFCEKLLCTLREVYDSDSCNIPDTFIHNYLKYKAFRVAVEAKDYTKAIDIYNSFNSSSNINYVGGCSCQR